MVGLASILTGLAGALVNAFQGAAMAVGVLYVIKLVLVHLIASLASGIDSVLRIDVVNNPVVTESWGIVRNFSNMFFIVALIVMAFATIFSISKYSFGNLIARFLITALLINFSLVIGEIIIGWSQSLSNVFLQAMGSIGDRVGQGANLADVVAGGLTSQGLTGVDSTLWQKTIDFFASILLLGVVFFNLCVLFFTSVVRIFFLWALLIAAPLAWTANILPSTSQFARKWWDQFIGWNVFMPLYLFIMYFGFLFISKKSAVMASVAGSGGSFAGITFDTLFFYVLITLVFTGGAKIARTASITASAGSRASWIYGKGVVLRRAAWRSTGIPGASKERWEQFKKEGFSGTRFQGSLGRVYGGAEGLERTQSNVANFLGVRGASIKQSQRDIQIQEDRFRKEGASKDDLDKILSNPNADFAQKIAAANIIKGQYRALKGSEVDELYEEYRKISPAEAAKWIRGQKDALEGLGSTELDKIYASTTDSQMKQFIARAKAKRDLIKNEGEWEEKIKLFEDSGNDATMASFIGESKEFIERIEVDKAIELLEKIPKTNKESVRKFATLIAAKGISQDKLIELTRKDKTTGDFVGAFESESEVMKFLDIAKVTNIQGALEAKRQAGVLRDLITKKKTDDIALVYKQELKLMSPKEMAKQEYRNDPSDPSKNIGLNTPMGQAALEAAFEDAKGTRIEDFYKSDEFQASPNKQFVENVLEKAKDKELEKNLLNPLVDAYKKIIVLAGEIKSSKDSGNTTRARELLLQAKTQQSAAKRLDKIISESKAANESIKNNSAKTIIDIEDMIKEANDYRGAQEYKKEDKTNNKKGTGNNPPSGETPPSSSSPHSNIVDLGRTLPPPNRELPPGRGENKTE